MKIKNEKAFFFAQAYARLSINWIDWDCATLTKNELWSQAMSKLRKAYGL